MKKEEIIFNVLFYLWFCLAVFLLWQFFETKDVRYLTATAISVLVIGIPLGICEQKQREKRDPLNFERRLKSLLYAEKKAYGTRDDFVKENGKLMYEHLLSEGFIHEISSFLVLDKSNLPVWEITKHGRDTAEMLKKENKSK